MVTVKRIDSTSVIVSWTVDNEGIHYFLVTYRKLADGSDERTINTTQTEIEITGLEPGVEYEFEVSVHSFDCVTHWNKNRKKIKRTTREKGSWFF